MNDCPHRLPGADHPIVITPHVGRVVVRVGGKVLVDTTGAVALKEAAYPAVLYVPREDADMGALERTAHQLVSVQGRGVLLFDPGRRRSANAVWTYETPFEAVAEIKDRLAVYPGRVDGIES